MSENHPSKPIRKAGPTTGELVLDRGLALASAGSDGCDPPQALRSLPPPCDYYMRSMEAVIARAAVMKAVMNGRCALK